MASSGETSEEKCNPPLPLPAGWSAHISQKRWPGRMYFYDSATGECTWTHPALRNISSGLKRARRGSSTMSMSDLPAKIQPKSSVNRIVADLCPSCQRPKNSIRSVEDGSQLLKMLLPTPVSIKNEKAAPCVCLVVEKMAQFLAVFARRGIEENLGSEAPWTLLESVCDRIKVPLCDWEADSEGDSLSVADSSGTLTDLDVFNSPSMNGVDELDTERCKSFELESHMQPTLDLKSYLARLWKYSRVSDSTFLAAFIYIIRLSRSGRLNLSMRNVYKTLLACTVVAAKFHEDAQLSNNSFAVVGGVSRQDLCTMETNLMFLLRWRLDVSTTEFSAAAGMLASFSENMVTPRPALRRDGVEKGVAKLTIGTE